MTPIHANMTSAKARAGDSAEPHQEPSRKFADYLRDWSDGPGDVDAAAVASRRAWGARARLEQARLDARTPRVQLDKLEQRVLAACEVAERLVEPIVVAGLEAREGRTLVPDAILPEPHTRELLTDYLAWRAVVCATPWPADHRPERARGLCVCDSCSLVFRPKRKARAHYCPLCVKRRAAEPLGSRPVQRGCAVQVRVPA